MGLYGQYIGLVGPRLRRLCGMEFKYIMTTFLVMFVTYISGHVHAQTAWLNTSLGQINGLTYNILGNDVDIFLGIPYARPPLEERRFAPPIPAGAWGTGNSSVILNATKYSPACPQQQTVNPDRDLDRFSEDCLYLNIFVPKVSEFLLAFLRCSLAKF